MSGTTTLQANTALNLDTGATASSGGDLLWSGSSLTPQGKASVALRAALGSTGFNIYAEAGLNGFRVIASAAAIPARKLPVNEVFAVYTNGGNVAKVLVTANSGTPVGPLRSRVPAGRTWVPLLPRLPSRNPLLTWTNTSAAATIDRTQDLQVTWTGGNLGAYVFITGDSTATAATMTAGFTCLAKADDGQFKAPSYILSALPAGSGGVRLRNDIYSSLPASGIDIGQTVGEVSYSVGSTFQ